MPPETEPSDSLPAEVLAIMSIHQLFWRIQDCVEGIEEELRIGPDLSKQEKHMLILLGHPQRMGALAKEMAALPSTITFLTDALEEKQLLQRVRDPDDRRAWLLRLTDAGEAIRSALVGKAGEMFRTISGLSPEETDQFARLANKARKNILTQDTPEGMTK